MSDKSLFRPEKLSMVEFKFLKGQIDTPENYVVPNKTDYSIENLLELSFNMKEKLIKVDFSINMQTANQQTTAQATGSFRLVYIYHIDNLEELITPDTTNSELNVNADLANTVVSISYSTSRGVLLARLQGTALQQFILPIINPNTLLKKNQ
jgi:hypothetical protein